MAHSLVDTNCNLHLVASSIIKKFLFMGDLENTNLVAHCVTFIVIKESSSNYISLTQKRYAIIYPFSCPCYNVRSTHAEGPKDREMEAQSLHSDLIRYVP